MADIKKAQDRLSSVRIRLLRKSPFFGSIAMKHPVVFTNGVETAAVDKRGNMYMNPDFLMSLNIDVAVFVVAHEAMHVAMRHAYRKNGRDHELWNIACDAVINDILKKEEVGDPFADGVFIAGAGEKTAEQVYEELKKSGGTVKKPGIMDLSDVGDATDEEVKQAEAEAKVELSEASASARMQGKLSGYLGGIIDQIITSKVPWRDVLERYCTSHTSNHHTWSRPNKRYLRTAYLPRRDRLPSMGEMVVGVDVSGSISDDDVRRFLGHVKAIAEQVNPERIHVVYCTTDIEHVDTFDSAEDVEPQKNRWSGGTDMGAIMRWVDDEGIDPDVTVVFTDGYTPYPEQSPDYDTLWVFTKGCSDEEPPFGELLHDDED